MGLDAFGVLDPGLGATLQDRGRVGWRRFGVPASGAMDDHAAGWANRLLNNPPDAPVLELLLQGAKLLVASRVWIAVTGADAEGSVPAWRTIHVEPKQVIHFPHNHSGVWIYLAVEGGFEAERILGSVSAYERGNLGRRLAAGDILKRAAAIPFELPHNIAGRMISADERRSYHSPPALRVWPGPQWNLFHEQDREMFFAQSWTVTSQSDRAGYRLSGQPLQSGGNEIISEPVRVGSIQIPGNGLPIVTMRDGPTVGGYPKLGLVETADLSWLAQCRPGQSVRFRHVE
ncbi:MAG: biotin-dependent carboxyltransferase family protein [Verrucomicrobia bacterium]|nr:biotin-dependent carboxyltransferase family protein [Verrucomicrobiota bacterium]